MNIQVYRLYKELKKPKTSIVSKIEVSNFSSYLLELVNEISTRRNKQDFIIRNTFKLKIKNSIDERNYPLRFNSDTLIVVPRIGLWATAILPAT
jgi:hypothetical protein